MTAQQNEIRKSLSKCLSVDLEVSVRDQRIHAFAGVNWGTGESVTYSGGRDGLRGALARLDDLAREANFLLGHNLIAFDLPHLRACAPDLGLLRLPPLDTLRLNPLAFPRNPYHHLVKHYQDGGLKRGRLNDPGLDARLALEVFDDQLSAFPSAPQDLLAAWHWLTTTENGGGFDTMFGAVRGLPRPTEAEARQAIYARLDGNGCSSVTSELAHNTSGQGWPLAYALAWLLVAGGNSVMPPWVCHQFPEAGQLVRRLRGSACTDPGCEWCRERHDAQRELLRWFGFPAFRAEPANDDGRPLQQCVVEAAMGGENVLAILPTGAGKSLCYQIPALSRYDKTGALTVVISPLVALMSDQVAGLESKGIESCVTVNSLLSMPERADALDRVRLGDAAIILTSPEQLRSPSVRGALAHREIGAWVLDEAHCVSKWGHDFRPDYRYVGRFIRERAGGSSIPSVLCLTATAKPDVKAEIADYFQKELGIRLRIFDGGAHRTNLEFVVVPTSAEAKLAHIHQILSTDLPEDVPGGGIVYCATRRQAEEVAEFLQAKGMAADFFHGNLPPETKKNVQQSFIDGRLRVISATNAFGMGIDKPDIRVVVHADIPGSLENYLQEAGRAGRDQETARCALLYTQEDVEKQFGMSARSRLTRQEIHGVLRALRNLDRRKRLDGEVVATPGEILGEDDEGAFERDSATDDTRVRTAVAWLEEADLLSREENRVQVFPSSLRISSVEEAGSKLQRADIADGYRRQLLAICESLIGADADDGISTDELMIVSGLNSEGVRDALYDLERLGIASNDTALTAFVHVGVERSSRRRLEEAAELEQALIGLMQDAAPDADTNESHPLHLRRATQQLKEQGASAALPDRLRRILRSIAADGRGEGGGGGSLKVRNLGPETVQVTRLREWRQLVRMSEVRREAAGRILDHLLADLPPGNHGTDLLAETTLGKLLQAVCADPTVKGQVREPSKLVDRALLWLHEQEAIRLNKGMAVFRPAMTIRLRQERRGFAQADYGSLKLHYDEQTLQIHVMAEFAQRGLASMAEALRLAMDYFSLLKDSFIYRWLPGRDQETSRQTTPESWQAIVDSLNNPTQRRFVADDREQTNVLALAGPGAGKTRVLVHRIAYLIRVRRENPRGILALAYNRHAAVEIRHRLSNLIGDDARGVVVLTCHSLAMRLTGASFTGRANRLDDGDFRGALKEASALLRGEGLPPEEADDVRMRLLAGFRWILVDEYQDIGPDQYELISALTGRSLAEADDKLTIFAVGDDDQNIYSFNGSSVEFIRRFEEDYGSRNSYLTENYRSTGHIISAANAVIEPSSQRMKAGCSITINRAREKDAPGGGWSLLDPVTRGQVQTIPAGDTPISQAQAVVAELKRLSALDPQWDWSRCAVVAREWSFLDPVLSLCLSEAIPVQMANEEFTGVWFLRETRALVDWVRSRTSKLVSSENLKGWMLDQPQSTWNELLMEALDEYALETAGEESVADHFIEWLAEWSRDVRRRQRGLLLLTAHRAKGLEFDHVVLLDGGWNRISQGEDRDAQRRLYYVAMTRARHTLTLARFPGPHPLLDSLEGNPSVLRRDEPSQFPPAPPELYRRYRRLSLRDVFLSYAGYLPTGHAVHRAIAALSPNDPLTARPGHNRWELLDIHRNVVGQLSSSFRVPANMRCVSATVLAIAVWDRESSEPEYRQGLQSDSWEVVLPELVFEPDL